MPRNLLNQLADVEVPPVPKNLDDHLHQRLNHWLLLGQLSDLALRFIPGAMFHVARAMIGLIVYTITGRYPSDTTDRSDSQ